MGDGDSEGSPVGEALGEILGLPVGENAGISEGAAVGMVGTPSWRALTFPYLSPQKNTSPLGERLDLASIRSTHVTTARETLTETFVVTPWMSSHIMLHTSSPVSIDKAEITPSSVVT